MCNYDILNNYCSDHVAVSACIDIPIFKLKDTFRMVRTHNEENWEKFIILLTNEDWHDMYNSPNPDIDSKSEIFTNKLILYYDRSFPLKKIIIRANQTNKVNLTASTRQIKVELRNLCDEIAGETNVELRQTMLNAKNSLKKYLSYCINGEVKKANNEKIQQSENKSRVAWKIIKNKTGQNGPQNNIEKLNINGKEEHIRLNIVEALNYSFRVAPPNDIEANTVNDYNFDIPQKCRHLFFLPLPKQRSSPSSQNWPRKSPQGGMEYQYIL
jgi:hypothetical protein